MLPGESGKGVVGREGREPSKSARSEKVPASARSQAGWGELWCVSYTSDFVGTPGKGAGFSYSLTASVVS